MATDHYQDIRTRINLNFFATPVFITTHTITASFASVVSRLQQGFHATRENKQLKKENYILKAQLNQLQSLQAENTRLRQLLKAKPWKNYVFKVAEVLSISSYPFADELVINQGKKQGVILGQPVVDDKGVIGQVSRRQENTSTVLLLGDVRLQIPVQVNRSGARGILTAGDNTNVLNLQYVTNTSDIVENDLIMTSGLGGHFPAGLPVGRVIHVEKNVGDAFISVNVMPLASLNSHKEVLLLSKPDKQDKTA